LAPHLAPRNLVSLTKQIHPPGWGHYGTVAFADTGGFRTDGKDSVLWRLARLGRCEGQAEHGRRA